MHRDRSIIKLPVNEIFETVQGEAGFTGTPAIFVRLHGCDVGCPWCDTKYTWKFHTADAVSFDEMIDKPVNDQRHAWVGSQWLAGYLNLHYRSRHVVITGGEPCDHDLTELTNWLEGYEMRPQIETSGTRPVRASNATWVTVSPKIDMPGGYKVLVEALERADEIKMPIGKPADVVKLKQLLDGRPKRPVWLQPLSQSEKATKLCISAARENGWRISCQVHKFLGVR